MRLERRLAGTLEAEFARSVHHPPQRRGRKYGGRWLFGNHGGIASSTPKRERVQLDVLRSQSAMNTSGTA